MRTQALRCFAVFILCFVGLAAERDFSSAALQGQWRIEAVLQNGRPVPNKIGGRLTFRAEEVTYEPKKMPALAYDQWGKELGLQEIDWSKATVYPISDLDKAAAPIDWAAVSVG
ncbi:MAG: hypothetical protein U0793_04725 [Gemmataceae bacterium]